MSLTAAASRFVVFLLSVSVIQSQNGWRVTYTSTQICAIKGSTVDIRCTYTYPYTRNSFVTNKSWFSKGSNNAPVYVVTEFRGRVEYKYNDCTLRIKDLRDTHSAVYMFMFMTNQSGGRYTGEPGVTLSVTALSVKVIKAASYSGYNTVEMQCHSSCDLPGRPSYIWYNNGQKIIGQTSHIFSGNIKDLGSISCAVKGQEKFPSPSVYPPQLPSVSVSPSAEIVEGSSVTLTCSSDANPAASYTWHKNNGNLNVHQLNNKLQLVFSSIQSSDYGQYYCEAENKLGRSRSEDINLNVKCK
ncbi:B-cell receptor CD22-like [Channa argus]|uniref:B-cell receptor CD22-like n=1 Tax=Channa argus TaxID=215402 RepID=UPI0035204824